MTKTKVLSFLKWALILSFALLICVELFDATMHHFDLTKAKRILLLFTLIAIILFKNKYTYLLALAIFVYGMYNIMIVGTFASTPTAMEFTQSITQIFNAKTNPNFVHRLARILPILFYFLSFLIFATPSVRKWYGFADFKGKSQSNYLR